MLFRPSNKLYRPFTTTLTHTVFPLFTRYLTQQLLQQFQQQLQVKLQWLLVVYSEGLIEEMDKKEGRTEIQETLDC